MKSYGSNLLIISSSSPILRSSMSKPKQGFRSPQKRSKKTFEKTDAGFEFLDHDFPSVNPCKKKYFW